MKLWTLVYVLGSDVVHANLIIGYSIDFMQIFSVQSLAALAKNNAFCCIETRIARSLCNNASESTHFLHRFLRISLQI